MFHVDYKKLTLSFNEFHDISDKDMPQYGEYCLLELKTGVYTADGWLPSGKGSTGQFLRGTGDTVDAEDVARWHSLDRYDLTDILEEEEINWINLGPEEGSQNVQFEGFQSFADGKNPEEEQFCLLIMKDGSLAADYAERSPEAHDNLVIKVTPKTDGSVEKAVVASISEKVYVFGNEDRLQAMFEDPQLQMASFTITEKGYALYGPDGKYLPRLLKILPAMRQTLPPTWDALQSSSMTAI